MWYVVVIGRQLFEKGWAATRIGRNAFILGVVGVIVMQLL